MLRRFCHQVALILLASSTLTASLGETNSILSFTKVEGEALRNSGAPQAAPSSARWAKTSEKTSSHTPPDYRVTRWSADNGLPQNTIKALIQTQDGYLWVGTLNGLARFDGLKFKIFDHSNTPEMITDAIDELVEDIKDGSLWIRAAGSVLRYRDHHFERFSSEQGFPKNMGGPIWRGGPGRIWCSPGSGRVGVVRDGRLLMHGFGPELEANRVIRIVEENPSQALVLLPRGLLRLDIEKGSMTPIKMPPEELHCYSFMKDVNEDLWLCRRDGIWKREHTEWRHITRSDNGPWPREIYRTRDGQTWIRSSDEESHWQLQRIIQGRLQTLSFPEFTGALGPNLLFEDREGNIWIGTYNGLFRLEPKRIKVFSRSEGLRNDDISAITEAADGTIWAATKEGVSGIRDGTVSNLPTLPGEPKWGPISTFLTDRQNRLWLGTANGALTCFHEGKWGYDYDLPSALDNPALIKTFYEDRQGRMWISTGTGVLCRESNPCVLYSRTNGLSHHDVRVIFQDRRGDMWFGTYGGGLNRLHDGKITAFTTTRGVYNNQSWWIHEDADGVFWVGSEDGLNRFAPPGAESAKHKEGSSTQQDRSLLTSAAPAEISDRFFTFTTQQGLGENVVNNIQEDNYGYLWLSGLRGIYRISRQELNEVASGKRPQAACIAYGEADGMVSSECNGGDNQPSGCKDRFGRIWFPTAQGVAMIDPKDIQRNEVSPPVVIEQVIADDEVLFGDADQPKNETLEFKSGAPTASHASRIMYHAPHPSTIGYHLKPGHARVLEIHYTANALTAPQRVRFMYKLDGYDETWRFDENNRRVAFYTGLRPGPYAFHVKACNNHGIWNEAGDSFRFSLAPHFWETWPFYAGSISIIVLGIFGLHHRRVTGLRRVQRLEQQRALHEERARIAQDLHDDLGANLTGVALQLDVARTQKNLSAHSQRELASIAGNTRRLVDNMREVVWAMNPQCDDTESLANFLGQYTENYLVAAGLRCRLEFPRHLPPRPLNSHARHQLFLVVKEALHNTVRHAGASEVHLRIEQTHGELRLSFSDNGCGLPPENERAREYGLDNMRKRVSKLGGQILVTSHPGAGTCITVKIGLTSQQLQNHASHITH